MITIFLAAVLAIFILSIDLRLPLGVAGGVPYVALVLTGIAFPKPRHIIMLAVIGSTLTIFGYFFSPDGGIEWVVLTNRGLALFAIWVTALLLVYLKQQQNQLRHTQEKLEKHIHTVDQYVITSTTDACGKITSASDAFCTISGYAREELLGKSHSIVRHPDMPKSLYKNLWKTIGNGNVWSGEIKNLKKNGGYYWVDIHISPIKDEAGNINGFTAVHQDITDKKLAEALSTTDSLTQLYNRRKLGKQLKLEIARTERYDHALSLLLIDIDHFKSINDIYGHQIGDDILTQIACLIRTSIRETDIPGRWGGEEFMVLCPETNEKEAVILAEKLRGTIEEYDFSKLDNSCTISIGVAMHQRGEPENTLVGNADKALYRAKTQGRNRVET